MSKNALRKELELMTAPQLRQIILDAYSARKEIKEYFEFFLRPDAAGLLERQSTTIARELKRMKRGRSRARATVIKKAVNDFVSLNPGAEACLDMIFRAIVLIATADKGIELPAAIQRLATALATRFVETADKAMMADKAAERLDTFFRNSTYRHDIRRLIAQNLGRP